MVYDPIRDREVPSPASHGPQSAGWRGEGIFTPGSEYDPSTNGTRGHYGPPPAFASHRHGSRSPSAASQQSRSLSGGGLRGLLNEDMGYNRRTSSENRSSISSTPDDVYEQQQHQYYQAQAQQARALAFAQAQAQAEAEAHAQAMAHQHHQQLQQSHSQSSSRGSIHGLLNNQSTAPPISKSNSASSLARSSSPSNASPGGRQHHLRPDGFFTPGPSSSAAYRNGRSPYPVAEGLAFSPGSSHQPLSYNDGQYSAEQHHAEQPARHVQPINTRAMPMLPPQDIPQNPHRDSDFSSRGTPTNQGLPLRSPSVSVSPRGYQAGLPYGHAMGGHSSRPGSSASNSHPFHQPTSSVSPARQSRRLSEDMSRPTSSAGGNTNSRKGTIPQRRASQVPAFSPPPRSPSPPPVQKMPYNPNRVSKPTTLFYPITPDEAAHLRSVGQNNNPLRRKKKRPLPSWSGPLSSSRLPAEGDTSYFPQQVDSRPGSSSNRRSASITERGDYDRQGSVQTVSTSRPSVTPGPPQGYAPARDGKRKLPSTDEGSYNSKRPSEAEFGDHPQQRRKVSTEQYVGKAGEVAAHYNMRPEVGVESREFSPIIGLKKFNNWIKSVLIGKFAFRANNAAGARVLDIGCGKGGDLNKWKQARIRLYVGMDIAATSVDQARDRYLKMHRPGFDAHFFAHDCYAKPLSDALPPQLAVRDLYDNVSMQFCMHYAFESASKARMMIENVSRYLRPGGLFVGTIPDSVQLLDRLGEIPEDEPQLKFGNSCYSIEFEERRHKGMYGHAYRFFLEDAVEDVPEYIVNWENFEALAAEYKLRLLYKRAFSEVLSEEQSSRDFGPLLGKMGVVNEQGESAMDADQWEAANLYMAFAFEKLGR